ncbi:MAG: hypothetical protein ACQKBY_10590 [Verrucomicrobiales bacterium]
MPSQDDIQYAMEATRVLYEPDRRIDTFGTTSFAFELLSEEMDAVNRVRVRRGKVEAQKPQLIRPDAYQEVELEGFDPKVLKVIDHFRQKGVNLAFLQYGFQFKRSDVTAQTVHDSLENVRGRVMEEARRTGDPALAVIEGVDDAWEYSVMKFTLEMIMKSQEINHFDFRRKGLL